MDHSHDAAHDLASAAAALTDSALARVWRIGPGDLCSSCAMAPECPDRSHCLHLTASVGATHRLDGPFRRFPIGARELGRVARDLEPFHTTDLAGSDVADPAWLSRHGVRSFGAWPVVSGDRCLAVLALFSRRALDPHDRSAVGALVRLAAAAMAKTAGHEAPRTHELAFAGAPHEPAHIGAGTMADVQRRAILAALTSTGGRLSGAGGAAEILGMKPTTLESRIRRLGLRKPPRLKLR